jgi:hypothetical protein
VFCDEWSRLVSNSLSSYLCFLMLGLHTCTTMLIKRSFEIRDLRRGRKAEIGICRKEQI